MIDKKARKPFVDCKDCITDGLRLEYERRLNCPYEKNGQTSKFIDQFSAGSGNEISTGKFWSKRSSARLCFDLYSWLANEPNCVDIRFEKKLPGIISGRSERPANMDVMIETDHDIWFIESKFTESLNNKDYSISLPEAYWKCLSSDGSENGGDWYHKSSGDKALVCCPILKRFRNHQKLSELFPTFCREVSALINNAPDAQQEDWFDAKQETCHLFGILCFILEGMNNGKRVHFENIVYNFNSQIECRSPYASQFIELAKKLATEIVGDGVFEYDTHSVQDVLRLYGNKKAYELDSSVESQLHSCFV